MSATYVHIHNPQPNLKAIDRGECLDCKKKTRFISFFTPWYGWESTCIRCGRSWQDGEWIPFDFARGVRQASISRAKNRWRTSLASIKIEHTTDENLQNLQD